RRAVSLGRGPAHLVHPVARRLVERACARRSGAPRREPRTVPLDPAPELPRRAAGARGTPARAPMSAPFDVAVIGAGPAGAAAALSAARAGLSVALFEPQAELDKPCGEG